MRKPSRDNSIHVKDHKREWDSWRSMIQRCTNQKHKAFPRYGGRGISVCERWRLSFAAFLVDMGDRPASTELDRFPNNDGNYEPGNCRWISRSGNCSNTSRNNFIEFNGERLTATQWSARVGVSRQVICARLKRGYPVELALSETSFLNHSPNSAV